MTRLITRTTISRTAKTIIKADQFPNWHKSFADKVGLGALFKTALNLRSLDTLKEWGEKLMRQHRPADSLALPDFMRPSEQFKAASAASLFIAPSLTLIPAPVGQASVRPASPGPASSPPEESAKRLVCSRCATKISFAEGKFC